MSDRLHEAAQGLRDRIVGWRRDLHRMPEIGFDVQRTAAFVEERLREIGLEPRKGIAETGMAAVLRAENAQGPAVLLRADMDALPIQEVDGREYGSETPGRMHACGHDGHMSMLLGAATLLAERRTELKRDVVFCFQPAEEGYGGGRRMIEEGVLDVADIGSVYALHLWSSYPVGTVHVRPGPIMAGQDEFTVVVRGKGGHGALPHMTRDSLLAAAAIVTALQGIVARNVDPLESAVLTVGSLHAGHAPNVIPAEAHMHATMRSFIEPVRELLRRRSREVIESVARAYGCEADYTLRPGYPATVNDVDAVRVVREAAGPVFGEAGVIESPPLPAAEDFSYFLQQRPGAFVLVGAGNESRGITAPHHSPEFDIDESALPRGAELLARVALSPRQPTR